MTEGIAYAVIVPAYRPGAEMLELVRELVARAVPAIVLADDGSGPAYADRFAQAAALPGVHLVRHAANQGKGAALKSGIRYALTAFPGLTGVVTADADGQHDAADIVRVADILIAQPDALVLGARTFSGEVPWRSRFGNLLTRIVLRAAIGSKLTDTQTGLRGIPAAAEDVMAARDLLLAELTGARYHIAHVSTRNAVAMLDYARKQGLPVSCEATPHHFALTDRDMAPYDSNYKMKPPLRSVRDRAAVVEAIAAGAVSAIATDHAPHPGSEKMQEFERCPFGIIGLETAIALALEELVHPGKITLNRMVELFTTGPDAVLRLGRGTLAPGSHGDVTVFSTDLSWTYDVNQSFSRSRNSPFHGRTFRGGPVATVVNGQVAWKRE